MRASRLPAFLWLLALPVNADVLHCEASNLQVDSADAALSQRVCDVAARAEAQFAACNLPPLQSPLQLSVVEQLDTGCVGVFHCGNQRIDILAPAEIAKLLRPDGAFSVLDPLSYFDSVIVHELAHAAFDALPCKMESCRTSAEFVAYSMQIMSFTPRQQQRFEQRAAITRRVSQDEINPMILAMAPELFAQRTWAHLNQQPDRCGYIGRITSGELQLGRSPRL